MKIKLDYIIGGLLLIWFIYANFFCKEESVTNNEPTQYQCVSSTSESQSLIKKQNKGYSTISDKNDLMMNIVANPTFSLEDFVAIGISKDNVSLRDIQVYRDDPYIRSVFTDEYGNLNEMRFQSVYHKASDWMKRLADFDNEYSNCPSYHRDNIFAPHEQMRTGYEYQQLQ